MIPSFDEALRRGFAPCDRADGCSNKLPELDHYSQQVLDLFINTQHLWDVSDMGGFRRRINRAELEIEARYRGVVLSEFFLDKFRACETVLRELDHERIEADRQRNEQRNRHERHF